ncbi:hypothetical protein AB0L13_35600 [Saccharopolyspora shandongensis]|uniref:hypothetical protein n=1 Tax=Saccharopolyspora shandongensis TaxID=418495 RepID=UPI00341956F4
MITVSADDHVAVGGPGIGRSRDRSDAVSRRIHGADLLSDTFRQIVEVQDEMRAPGAPAPQR